MENLREANIVKYKAVTVNKAAKMPKQNELFWNGNRCNGSFICIHSTALAICTFSVMCGVLWFGMFPRQMELRASERGGCTAEYMHCQAQQGDMMRVDPSVITK